MDRIDNDTLSPTTIDNEIKIKENIAGAERNANEAASIEIPIGIHFKDKNEFFNNLLSPSSEQQSLPKIFTEKLEKAGKDTGGFVLRPGKIVAIYSSRVSSIYEDKIILECLIDKENSIYEEREFSMNVFISSKPFINKLYLLRIWERDMKIDVEIHDAPGLVLESDFPRINFKSKYKDSKIFKKS